MTISTSCTHSLRVLIAAAAVSACADAPANVLSPGTARLDAVKFWEVTASTRWNERTLEYVGLRPPANGQAATSRILTYVSVAQYRAVLAAEAAKRANKPVLLQVWGGDEVSFVSVRAR